MFYLCSIGSNLDPVQHVSQAVGELLARFGHLRLSSVIQTKPVGMRSSHDFLNCLLVVESELSASQLKAEFVTMELTHGRDRSNPLCKVTDRPLDIDILASAPLDSFAAAEVDAYLGELLAELYERRSVRAHKVALRLPTSKVFAEQIFGHESVELWSHADDRQGLGSLPLTTEPRPAPPRHQ